MRTFILSLLLLIGLTSAKAQTNDCMKDFDFLVKKIKFDYPGYQDKVTAKTNPDLKKLEKELKKKRSI